MGRLGLAELTQELPADGQGKIKRLQSVFNRTHGMSSEHLLDFLEYRALVDTDRQHQPTQRLSGIYLAQLDYILARPEVQVTNLPSRRLAGTSNKVRSALVK
jgi:hypothetical protein